MAFKYETTVCAALPVLATIEQLVNAGDRITGFEAIVSGTLNYLLSNYNGTESFASLVVRAKELGYTEPDPRTDLSGSDVLRKFIIATRQAGIEIEKEEIEFSGLVPEELLDPALSPEEFYRKLEAYEPEMKKIYGQAASEGKRLRFTARYAAPEKEGERPVYKVALTGVDAAHPFYAIEGSDNAFAIKSLFYPNGIVIKGAGAGAVQTAGGVLNDILNCRRPVTTNTALLVEAALGIPAHILTGLQMDYNMQTAKKDKSFMERLANIRKIAAVL